MGIANRRIGRVPDTYANLFMSFLLPWKTKNRRGVSISARLCLPTHSDDVSSVMWFLERLCRVAGAKS